jgi:hypothetical protein
VTGMSRVSESWVRRAGRCLAEWFSVCQDSGFGHPPALTIPLLGVFPSTEPEPPQQDGVVFGNAGVAEQINSQDSRAQRDEGFNDLSLRQMGGSSQ